MFVCFNKVLRVCVYLRNLIVCLFTLQSAGLNIGASSQLIPGNSLFGKWNEICKGHVSKFSLWSLPHVILGAHARTNISMSDVPTNCANTHTHTGRFRESHATPLTYYFDKAILGFGRHRVDLTHVPSHVLLLHVVDMQKPSAMLVVLIVRHANPRIARYHMIVHRQNGRLLKVHPRHLQEAKDKGKFKSEMRL